MKKLRSRRGETLAETLVSLLVIALSSAILGTMLSAAVRINTAANSAADALYGERSKAEAGADSTQGSAAVSGITDEIPIRISGADGSLSSYTLAGGRGT